MPLELDPAQTTDAVASLDGIEGSSSSLPRRDIREYARRMAGNESERSKRPIASAVLKDGTLLEMVFRADEHRTAFARCADGRVSESEDFQSLEVGSVVPFAPTNNLLAHGVILFPSEASAYENDSQLAIEIRAFIHRYADLSDAFEEIATHYVPLTWVYDAFNEVPYLRLKGDFGSGKSRCLQAIGSICYKPMFVSGASTISPMFRIIDSFRGTLVLDESDFRFSDEKAEIVKILNNGNAAGFPVLRTDVTPSKEFNPRAFEVFGPKIIASRSSFDDPALESRCLTESLSGKPPRKDIPVSLPESFHEEALVLRNKLLTFRFRHRLEIAQRRAPDVTLAEARMAQIIAPLLAVAQETSAREHIAAFAVRHTMAINAERESSLEAQILDIMSSMRREGAAWNVKDIAVLFGDRYGSDYNRVSPRWMGAQLRRRLSLIPVKSNGNFVVPKTAESQVMILCERYGVLDEHES